MSDGGGRPVPSTPPSPGEAARLTPYFPRLVLHWLADTPEARYQQVDGTLLFVDVSGFTALTERLAARGKVGAEEITDVIGAVFGELLRVASLYGGDLLKWGGDAVLLHFAEPDSAARAGRAAVLMTRAIRRIGQFRTSAGRIALRVSIGAHSGAFDLYLLGDRHRELIVTGPQASVTARMEAIAEAGEVVVSAETARRLGPDVLGDAKSDGVILAEPPDADPVPERAAPVLSDAEVASLLPADRRLRLLGGDDEGEHRQATVAFVEFSGIDALTNQGGGDLVAAWLDPVIHATQAAAERNGVNFHETDIGSDGGKVVLLGGVPVLRGNDAERVLRTVHEVVSGHPRDSPVGLRAGVNAGRIFVFSHNFGSASRRVLAVTGDTMNLAARVMGKAAPGQVVATDAALVLAVNPFATEPLPPFAVKGKSELVIAATLVKPRYAASDQVGDGLPFVGREEELTEILRRAEDAASGSGGLVDIAGDPGIGKSRLVSEAMERWTLSTSRVGCEEYGSATPYAPIRRILRRLLGLGDDAAPDLVATQLRRAVRERVAHLEPLLPLLADVVDVGVPATRQVDELEHRFRRPRLEDCVVQLLRSYLSAPSALVFEDAHAMDEASASLVGRLVEETTDLPLLVVLTRERHGRTVVTEGVPRLAVELEPLRAEAAARLAAAGGGPTLSPAQVAAIVERADGNPLFLRELQRSAATAGGVEGLPGSLEPLLVAEIDRLAESDRQVLRAAAVLGTSFDPLDVGQVLDAAAPVDESVWLRLGTFVAPTAAGWRFAHGLMRDAAYEGLSFRRRSQWHGRAARAIETRLSNSDDAADVLSLHWLHAGGYEEAWRYARLAGDRARALWANADAATLYARALEAAARLTLSPAEVAAVAEALGDASELTADYHRARQAYSQARRHSDDGVDRARLLRKLGVLHERQGRYREALTCYSRGRRLLPGRSRAAGTERAELDLASAGVRSRQGRFSDCTRFAAEAAREATRVRYRPGLAHALYLQHNMSVYLGRPTDKLGFRSLAIFEELGDLVGQGNALNNLGVGAYFRGQWDAALEYWERSREARMRAGDVVGAATEENNLAEILSDQGRFAEARSLFETAHATWQAAGYRVGAALATSNLGRLEARAGEVATAAHLLDRALEEFQEMGSTIFIAETRLRLAECHLLAGDFGPGAASAGDVLADVRGRPGLEQTEVAALRVLGAAVGLDAIMGTGEGGRAGEAGGGGEGGEAGEAGEAGDAWRRSLDEAVEKATAMDARYELALALGCRATLGQLTATGRRPGHPAAHNGEGPDRDRDRADEIFAQLGVHQAVITWSPAVVGAPLLAGGAGTSPPLRRPAALASRV